ncbi:MULTISPECIES: ribonuclease HII [unclassified Variovorax]|uniref:ribonuclease HII n=1 Tax=unclassified Variovorax TaxID=663243 RepID=UPI00076C051D|nr:MULTISPECIES: ribonuclease HII [unclassified Variovorax]KWT98488.1 Ribonuclease HII [Variovorax sp. WDL1]PNG49837.1 Ribonuclease HII [Variovorax sp. B2]PNG50709.1 Ribonuclease HII [Variovorax sp. B4]VTU42395.1 Ribonuclease HII [Variovorax sp. PBL-H6]VTU43983.1 Ribonuclease HII [Variovorax sp. SRS16]
MSNSPFKLVCGVDEAGRGPLAGPVYAAAVIFRDVLVPGLDDSKKLSARRREALLPLIEEHCWVGVGVATAEEIDKINILQATFLAMERAVAALPVRPDLIRVDGNRLPRFENFAANQLESLVGGDALCPQISAASIVAKVRRDRHMVELDARYPGYGFSKHSGYGVAAHMEALRTRGPCPEHRQSFAPVRAAARR